MEIIEGNGRSGQRSGLQPALDKERRRIFTEETLEKLLVCTEAQNHDTT